jgi:putative DNA primase/helicase
MLTGQDLVYADVKLKRPFTFENYAKLMFSANELPPTDDTTEAFWRRWILVEFPNEFPEGDPRTNERMLEELTAPEELSGFLNFALEGLRRLLNNHTFTMSKSRRDIEREWVARSDSLRAFVADFVQQDPGCWVSKEDFYTALQEFCSDAGLVPPEKNMVGRRLPVLVKTAEIHPWQEEKKVRAWKGIRLLGDYAKYNHETGQKTLNENENTGNNGNGNFFIKGITEEKNLHNINKNETFSVTSVTNVLVEFIGNYGDHKVGEVIRVTKEEAERLARAGVVRIVGVGA